MFGVFFLYRIRSLEKWAKVITIDMRGWNIKTNLIEKASHLDKLIATIRRDHVFNLSWKQGYYPLLAAHSECYSISYKSKVTSCGFISFWVLCPVWIRVCYNRLIAKSIIDYLILASIKQIPTKIQSYLIILIWEIYHLLSKFDYSKSYVRIWANH